MKIGFMQGRLSPIYRNRIQSFPWNDWKKEFRVANSLNIKIMEWTIDSFKFHLNPIFSKKGIREIQLLKKKNNVQIDSITADYFMEKPFWKNQNQKNVKLRNDLIKLIDACELLKIKYIVMPIIDNGSFQDENEERYLVNHLNLIKKTLFKKKIQIIFETDMPPRKVLGFIKKFDDKIFGINYDIGNSAGLGYKLVNEFKIYGKYVKNVHLKDKKKRGVTTRFGKGDANFKNLFKILKRYKYKGNYILQSARAKKGKNQINELEYNLNYIKNIYEK